jgi:GABA permease
LKDDTTRVELMAIPIVAVVLGVLVILAVAANTGPWAWILVVVAAIVLLALLGLRWSRSHRHPVADTPAPAVTPSPAEDGHYRILVIADESCVEPSFAREIASHGAGRKVEALVIAPAIGSWLARWTGDESAHEDARKHLDETVTSLARAGITARGETGADDPLQAADDGLRDFAADEIVFVTKPGTDTDWVEKGVVDAARTRYPVPVTHIALSAG